MEIINEIQNFLTENKTAIMLGSIASIVTIIGFLWQGKPPAVTLQTQPINNNTATNNNNNNTATGGNASVSITNTGLAEQQHKELLAAIEKKNGISHETLRGALKDFIDENTPDDQLPAELEKWASKLVALSEQLSKPSNDGAEAKALRAQALELLKDDKLEKASALLAKANDVRRENRQARNREDASLLANQAEFENLLFHREKAISLLKEAVELDPTNIEALVNLGDTLATLGQRQEAQNIFEKAHAQSAEQGLPREESICLNRIGDMLKSTDAKAALGFYQKDLAIIERLAGADETHLDYQRELSVTYNKIGDMLANTDAKAALGFYQKSLAIRERLAGADEANLAYQRDLSVSYNKIGDMLADTDAKAALGFYQKSLAIAERLAGADETNLDYQRELSASYTKIGDMLRNTDAKAALGLYQKSLDIFERLAGEDETNLDYQRDLSVTYNKIGDMLRNTDAKAALGFYQKSLAIAERLAGADKTNLDYQRDLAIAYRNLASMGQSPRENFGRAHDIFARLKELGYLAPSDHWVVEETAHERDAATE